MSCLNEQVWFNQTENAALTIGLNLIVNGFARLKGGGVYAPEVLYFNVAHKFPKRLFDEEIYHRTLNLRNCLQARGTATRAHYRLDFLDFSIAAFALRLGRAQVPAPCPDLGRKLEKYRKRRKRAVQKSIGADEYQALEMRWTGYVHFVRYYITPMRQAPRAAIVRNQHKDQFAQLMTFAANVIEERCTAPVPPGELNRIVLQFKNDARRGRKGMRLRELLAQPERLKQMLFGSIRKRGTLHLKPEFQSLDVRSSARAQKFNAALVIEDDAGNTIPAKAPILATIRRENVVESLGRFFLEKIHRDDWARVKDQVELLSSRCSLPPQHLPATSFEALIQQWEPPVGSVDIFEDINQAVSWLISCLSFIDAKPLEITTLVSSGYAAAMNR